METYPHLFTAMQLGEQRFRNRIAFASMFTARACNGDVTPELITFYENRAAGGASLIVTEPLNVLRHAEVFGAQVRVYQRQSIDGLRQWADAVRKRDAGIIAQLQDTGRGDVRPRRKSFSLAPSSLADDLSWTMPHAMSTDEIATSRDDFVAAAETLQKAGFNGVEISSGHGHLYHQFLSPWSNHRNDAYGGERTNRIRVLFELVDGIRATCGDHFIIGIRLPGNDGLPGSIDWDEAGKIADALTRGCRLDYLNFVQGTQASTLYMHLPDMHMPRGTYADEIGRLRLHCNGVPVASTGRIVEPVQAETLLSSGKADFVMMGRTLLADPAWGIKAQQNRDGMIRKCVSGNNCWGEVVHHSKPLACDNNPRVARIDEVDWWPKRATSRRRLTIMGSGLAGLETAWIAAARGHEVTLFSQSGELGGKARLYASMPGCEAASSIFDYQIAAAQRAGVNFKLSHNASFDEIASTNPDAVVVATGGEMLWPVQLPAEWKEWGIIPDLWSLIADFGRMREDSGTAVLYDFDGTDVTYSAAQVLSHRFARVVIINPVECLARDEALVKRQAIYRRLLLRGVEAWPWSEPSPKTDLEQGSVVVRNIMSGRETAIEGVSLFTYATPRRPRDELVKPLKDAGYETHVIGDAYIPRSTMATVREAHDLGENLWAPSPNSTGN
ncbi:MAG: NAD(P)-binding protein [Alphaproteobacteria bacterium]|nr:NAD(P)-binding protein [Alphaproteobacteria bacterium]